MVLKFRENVKNHVNVNIRDENFVVACGDPIPTAELRSVVNFHEKTFCDWMSNDGNHENSVPWGNLELHVHVYMVNVKRLHVHVCTDVAPALTCIYCTLCACG